MKYYRVDKLELDTIEEIEIVRETEKCVFVKEGYNSEEIFRIGKDTEDDFYFPTIKEAQNEVLRLLNSRYQSQQEEVETTRRLIATVRKW